jgi:hypothetical protein
MNEYDLIKNEISQVINSNYKFCIEVSGRWGIGKTFLISTALKKLGLRYRYISLMSYNDMNELKFEMSNTFGKLIKIVSSAQTKINISEQNQNFIKDIFNKGKEKILQTRLKKFKKQKDLILVFDDIERFATDKETLKSLFGYINFLKNDYKIIIILNNEEIYKNDDLKKTYTGLVDKLYDERYYLEIPPYEEFIKNFELDNKYIDYLIDRVSLFDIRNLRNIRKSVQIFVRLKKIIRNLKIEDDEIILKSILEDLIILVDADNEIGLFSKYEKKIKEMKICEGFFNGLLSKNYSFYDPDEEEKKEEMPEEDRAIVNLQRKYKLSTVRDVTFVPTIYKYIKSGIFDEKLFEKEILSVKSSFKFEVTYSNLKNNLWGLNSLQFEEGMTNLINCLNFNKLELDDYQNVVELMNILYEKKIYDNKEITKINDKIIENLINCDLKNKEYTKNMHLYDEFIIENSEVKRNINPHKLENAKKSLYIKVLVNNFKTNLDNDKDIKYVVSALNNLDSNSQKEILNIIVPVIETYTMKCINNDKLRNYYFTVRDNAFNLKEQFSFSKELYALFKEKYLSLRKKIHVKHGPAKYYFDNIEELYK